MKRDWLAKYRKHLTMTHQDVANSTGISRQYYGMIENGERMPSVDVAKKLGKLFNFNWTIFFDDSGYKTLQLEKNSA